MIFLITVDSRSIFPSTYLKSVRHKRPSVSGGTSMDLLLTFALSGCVFSLRTSKP